MRVFTSRNAKTWLIQPVYLYHLPSGIFVDCDGNSRWWFSKERKRRRKNSITIITCSSEKYEKRSINITTVARDAKKHIAQKVEMKWQAGKKQVNGKRRKNMFEVIIWFHRHNSMIKAQANRSISAFYQPSQNHFQHILFSPAQLKFNEHFKTVDQKWLFDCHFCGAKISLLAFA